MKKVVSQQTASGFIKALKASPSKRDPSATLKFFQGNDGKIKALGVPFGVVFKLAKEYIGLPLVEVNKLLDSNYYEVRMGAVSIMDFQARDKKLGEEQKKRLFDLYLERHDRLNNWDFVDRGAYNIVGEYLLDKPRKILYKLAKSKNIWERRTAIVATYAFIKNGEVNDTFKIAEILVNDKHELIQKAVGSWIREAGKKDEKKLCIFLDKHATTMPRFTLRYAVEKLDKKTKEYYMNLAKNVKQ